MSNDHGSPKGRPADPAKREAILAAASAAFFEHGFGGASIEQIAADANVSKVTVYNHFGDKRALFTAAVEEECSRLRTHFSIDDIGRRSLREHLTAIGTGMVAFLSRPEMVQFERRIAAETEKEPELGAVFLAAGPHRMKQAFARFIRQMCDAGTMKADDPDLAAEQFVSMCKGMGDLERRFGHPSDPVRNQARIAGAVDVFCCAYAAETP